MGNHLVHSCRSPLARRRHRGRTASLTDRDGAPLPAWPAVECLEPRQLLSNQPVYTYSPATGDVTFNRNGFDSTKDIQALTLYSATGLFQTGAANGYAANQIAGGNGLDLNTKTEEFAVDFGGCNTATLDLGDILPANLTQAMLSSDLSGYYAYQGGPTGPTGDGMSAAITLTTVAPILSGSPVINGDNPNGLFTAAGQAAGVQRSMVEDVVYTFSEAVTIPTAAAAFTVVGAGANPGTAPVSLTATAVAGTGGTQWAVTLTGKAAGVLASIANGEYSITINPAGVSSAADGTTQLAAGRTDQFYRLYGDINGKGVVNALDNLALKKAITIYNPAFDSNGDGAVNALDNLAFKKDLTVAYFGDGFVPTI